MSFHDKTKVVQNIKLFIKFGLCVDGSKFVLQLLISTLCYHKGTDLTG